MEPRSCTNALSLYAKASSQTSRPFLPPRQNCYAVSLKPHRVSCGRDFNKLVERIADQSRFEEEQRAARAAENSCLEREGESHLEAGRKPKGLVWEVG